MAFDEQDRFDHTETDNHVNEQNQTQVQLRTKERKDPDCTE